MLKKKFIVVAIAALVALIGTGVISDRSTRVIAESVAFTEHTRDVLLAIDQLRGALAEAESNIHGYVITGASDFKISFDSSVVKVNWYVGRLEDLTKTDAHQKESLVFVKELVTRRMQHLSSLASLKDKGTAQSEIDDAVMTGLVVNRSIGTALDEIRSDELLRLDEQHNNAQSAIRSAIFSTWASSIVAILLFAVLLLQVYGALQRDRESRIVLERAIAHEMTARQRAQEADQLKDDFLATLSHELRTPLTAIMGWTSLLADAESRGPILDEGLANIAQAARTQSQLIEDLLDVSRIITGKMKLSLTELNLAGIIEQAVATVAPSARAKEIELRMFLDDDASGVVGDSGRLQQVVWNLLSNSIKFTPKRGRVEVSLRRVGSHVEISVEDNGEGIPPDLLPHVFERFRQGDSTISRRSGGLGLGLSIVKHFVELHGGAVRVESAGPGAGSKFTVELPIAAVQKSEEIQTWRSSEFDHMPRPTEADRPGSDILAGRRIVAVDNDLRTLEVVAAILSSAGADVLTATNTSDAATLIAAERTDALICDVGLPGEDGLAFIRRLRSMLTSYAQLPAIALTAFARDDDRIAALAAGFNAYLVKPVSREELLFAVASLLRLVHDNRERGNQNTTDRAAVAIADC